MRHMLLTPTERDRLLIFTAAELARARRARGLRLNVPETIALVADTVCEAARDGARHAEALAAGRAVLGPDDVLPGVADVVTEVAVEAVFDDGSRLVVVPDPVGGGHLGDDAPGAVLPAEPRPAASGRRRDGADRRQHRGRPRVREQPLPLLRGQPAAALRPGRRATAAIWRSPRGRPSASTPASRSASGWCRSAATASSWASRGSSTARSTRRERSTRLSSGRAPSGTWVPRARAEGA